MKLDKGRLTNLEAIVLEQENQLYPVPEAIEKVRKNVCMSADRWDHGGYGRGRGRGRGATRQNPTPERPGKNAPTPERPRFGGGMYSDTIAPEPSPSSERPHRQDRSRPDVKSPDSRHDTARHALGDGVRKDEVKKGRGRGRGRPTIEVYVPRGRRQQGALHSSDPPVASPKSPQQQNRPGQRSMNQDSRHFDNDSASRSTGVSSQYKGDGKGLISNESSTDYQESKRHKKHRSEKGEREHSKDRSHRHKHKKHKSKERTENEAGESRDDNKTRSASRERRKKHKKHRSHSKERPPKCNLGETSTEPNDNVEMGDSVEFDFSVNLGKKVSSQEDMPSYLQQYDTVCGGGTMDQMDSQTSGMDQEHVVEEFHDTMDSIPSRENKVYIKGDQPLNTGLVTAERNSHIDRQNLNMQDETLPETQRTDLSVFEGSEQNKYINTTPQDLNSMSNQNDVESSHPLENQENISDIVTFADKNKDNIVCDDISEPISESCENKCRDTENTLPKSEIEKEQPVTDQEVLEKGQILTGSNESEQKESLPEVVSKNMSIEGIENQNHITDKSCSSTECPKAPQPSTCSDNVPAEESHMSLSLTAEANLTDPIENASNSDPSMEIIDTNKMSDEVTESPKHSNDHAMKIDESSSVLGKTVAKEEVAKGNKGAHDSKVVAMETNTQGNDEEEEGDTWDALFDDEGEALDPKLMQELTIAVGKDVEVKKTQFDYYDYQPKDPDLDYAEYDHLIEIYDFPKEFITRDIIIAFKEFQDKGFDIKWVDDNHAIGVFSSAIAASSALQLRHPMIKVRPLCQAIRATKLKAKRTAEFLQPYKPRPETVASVARNLVAGALGLQSNVPREVRAEERRRLKEAKERKREMRRQKQDTWDGRIGKCAMDDD